MKISTDEDGAKYWHNENDLYHREDGPAVEGHDGYKEWWVNGRLHRLDGPAIEYSDGSKYWFYHGKYIICETNEEFKRIIKLKIFW